MTKKNKYFSMKKIGETKGQIDIYGDIVSESWRWFDEETSAVSFRNALDQIGEIEELDIYINSGGGDVFEAVAISTMIKRHKAKSTIYIDGLAASAASMIAMAGDKVVMATNSMLMIHNAWSHFSGDHKEMREYAEQLERINETAVKQSYINKNPDIDVDKLSAMMDAETWLSAKEAIELGLADEESTANAVAASITKEQMARYKNAPELLAEKKESDRTTNGFEALTEAINKISERLDSIEQKNTQTEESKPSASKGEGTVRGFLLSL